MFDSIAGGLSRIVGIINISNKPWFAPFTAIYAGVVKAMELVPNPAEALNDGVDKLFDKIAASGPVQSIMKPLEGPVNSVGGMIEQVTDQATGGVRPDLYKEGSSIDVKNYKVESASGRSNLAKNIEKQYCQRVDNLPTELNKRFWIDIRGQNVCNTDLTSLYNDIMKRTNNCITITIKTN